MAPLAHNGNWAPSGGDWSVLSADCEPDALLSTFLTLVQTPYKKALRQTWTSPTEERELEVMSLVQYSKNSKWEMLMRLFSTYIWHVLEIPQVFITTKKRRQKAVSPLPIGQAPWKTDGQGRLSAFFSPSTSRAFQNKTYFLERLRHFKFQNPNSKLFLNHTLY